MTALPIDSYLPDIRVALDRARAVVVTAQPGSGKTTRVPPALVDRGPAILLQPRRVAARSVAARIASERGWSLGADVGWHVRFDRRSSPRTRLLVVTEGILTARLQSDPLLSDFLTIVLDEFHERSIHGDLALALAKQAWRARSDLRLVVMSATLDVAPVTKFLQDCPVVHVPGQLHPLETTYEPGAVASEVACRLAARRQGDVLCFMPGAAEIRRTVAEIDARRQATPGNLGGVEVLPLHGAMDGAEQDRTLAPHDTGITRIIVATNIAETSLTVPGVRSVVDAGWQKVARYDAARGIDSLAIERITQDSADQRAGRAGRVGSGCVVRLWDVRDRLKSHREPDIHRIDLAKLALDVLAWGGRPSHFEWFEPPRPDRLAAALELLVRLGAARDEQLTDRGRLMQKLPLHPRLASLLIEGQGHPMLVRACALLSERLYLPPRRHTTTSDLLSALDQWDAAPAHVIQAAQDIGRIARGLLASTTRPPLGDREFRRAILSGYPDRVGHRRERGSARVKLATGPGAVMSSATGVTEAEFLVALDVRAASDSASASPARRSDSADNDRVIHMASQVEPEWLTPSVTETRTWFDEPSGQVRAVSVERYGAIIMREHPCAVDDDGAAHVLAEAWLQRGPGTEETRLLRRLEFAGREVDVVALVRAAAYGHRSLSQVNLMRAIDASLMRVVDYAAPETLLVPSGRAVRLEYEEGGRVTAAVKLQELFGLAETPRIGPRQEPVVFALLSPSGRPVQVTSDLRSFWDRTYPDVRRELRGRYPRHPWPEDPWRATPTARTRRRGT